VSQRPIRFALVRETDAITDADCKAVAAAYSRHIRQLGPLGWPFYADAYFPRRRDPRDWPLILTRRSDVPGAAAYHETTERGAPIGYVFVDDCLEAGMSWTVALSHEGDEMLGDPNAIAMFDLGRFGLAAEICDPVQGDQFAIVDGGSARLSTGERVLMTDTVSLAWFDDRAPGPYDLAGFLDSPLTLLPGGYVSLFDYAAEQWQQRFARGAHAEGVDRPARIDAHLTHRLASRQAARAERLATAADLLRSTLPVEA
jgi:hypothetical protein